MDVSSTKDFSAALWGFAGTLVGAFSSIATQMVQNRNQNRAELRKTIVDSAYKDYELRFKSEGAGPVGFFQFPVMLAYYQKTIELIEKEELTPENAKKIVIAMGKMRDALLNASQEFESGAQGERHS